MKKMLRAVFGYFRQTDGWLWLLCLGLSGFSLVLLLGILDSGYATLLGISGRTLVVQAMATGLGVLCAVILSKIDYHTLTKLWKLHVPLAYAFVGLTFIIGTGTAARLGDKSWLALPGNMTVQPAEFLKLSFILAFAYHIYMVHNEINRPQNVLALCIHGAIPILLIHFQGDDGSALVFAAIFVCMIFAAGVSWKYILPAGVAGIAAIPLLWFFLLNDDQKQRFIVLYDATAPDPRQLYYQQHYAKLAIGSGKIWGKGIFSDAHKYVPELHNDFIFAFIGESLGFVGALAVVVVITVLCVKLLSNAHVAEDLQGRLICVGVFAMISFQAIVNIGVCISILPVIGITLPFLSYGGSSVLASYLGVGLVLSVYMRNPKSLFSE